MNKKILVIILVILVIISITLMGMYIIIKNKNNNDINSYLKDSMIKYGEKITKDNKWLSEHKFDNNYNVYLSDLIKNKAISEKILKAIDCNQDNTYLIIKKEGKKITFDTMIDCITNIDSKGRYYSYESLVKYLENYGPSIIKSFNYKTDNIKNYRVSLKQLEDIYNYDLSMFKENYDMDNSYLYIYVGTKEENYKLNYDVSLVRK